MNQKNKLIEPIEFIESDIAEYKKRIRSIELQIEKLIKTKQKWESRLRIKEKELE